ncbi:MAG: hypothetical protein R8M38_01450 [Mariprofundaceae bacterium]
MNSNAVNDAYRRYNYYHPLISIGYTTRNLYYRCFSEFGGEDGLEAVD